MSRNPKFDKVLQIMQQIHDRKNHDYAADTNPYSNFESVAQKTGLSVDDVFKVLMAVKEARLEELTTSGKKPNFEAVNDTRIDQAVYAALRASYYLTEEKGK